MEQLKIIAVITIKPQYQEELIKILKIVVDETRKEDGNISYDLHQDINNSLKYTIIEVWKSDKAIELHNNSKHFQDFVKSIESKVENLTVDTLKLIY